MSEAIDRLKDIMRQLRDPKTGCPWDLEQDFKTIAPHTLEEAYEVVDAIERNSIPDTIDELGDLLFQVAFHAQIGAEKKLFDLDEIATKVVDKMIERHPHVFGARQAENAAAVVTNWEADKAAKRALAAKGKEVSALDHITKSLPAMSLALKLQSRAARVGFDWSEAGQVFAKIKEEIAELEHEVTSLAPKTRLEDELGDVLFAVINLARKLDIEPESALRSTNRKFERRFRSVETRVKAKGRTVETTELPDLEEIWTDIKREEKAS